jgi:hypothetical protein
MFLPHIAAPGDTIQIEIAPMSAPATCTIRIVFPDASTVNLAPHVAVFLGPQPGPRNNAYGAIWNYKIPAATSGTLSLYWGCTYLGIVRYHDVLGTILIQ